MSELEPKNERLEAEDQAGLHVDLYKLKLSLTPRPPEDALSRVTLKRLREDVFQSIMRACRDLFGLAADLMTAARSITRGVGGLSPQKLQSVARAHQLSDARESSAAEKAKSELPPIEEQRTAIDNLVDVLNSLRAHGISAHVTQLKSGELVVSAVRPELEGRAQQAADLAVARYFGWDQQAQDEFARQRLERTSIKAVFSTRTTRLLNGYGFLHLIDLDGLSIQNLRALEELTPLHIYEILMRGSNYGVRIRDADTPFEQVDQTMAWNVLKVPLEVLDLPVHINLKLGSIRCKTVYELLQYSTAELVARADLTEQENLRIYGSLRPYGLHLRGTDDLPDLPIGDDLA